MNEIFKEEKNGFQYLRSVGLGNNFFFPAKYASKSSVFNRFA
jgi:hypothetical protein